MRYARTGQSVNILAEAVSDTSYLEYTSTVESLTAYGSDDGAESEALTGVTAEWDTGMGMFRITVPANQCPAEGHMFYVMVDWTGIIDVKAEFYMTNAETNINTLITTVNGISTTVGGISTGHIITDYSFDPANNQITITETGYTTIKSEQIISIFNATTGTWLYNSETRKYGAEPGKPWTRFYPLTSVADGVITYTAPDLNATSEDKLQIIVNIT